MKLKLGCDPEVFLTDLHGQLIASCGKIGGTKAAPMPLPLGEGYCVQEDNVAMEFNIPAANRVEEFVESIGKTLKFLNDGVKESYGFTIGELASADFPDKELQHPAAQEFGCDPDFNAWTGKKNPRPRAPSPNLRSCGGHVHIGYNVKELGDDSPQRVVRCMDLFLGVPSVLMDKDEKRKQLYGKRGAYRVKPYGVEYRTLSNFWIFNPRLRQWVWENTHRAVDAVVAQFPVEEYSDQILDAIDNNNKDVANQLVKQLNLEVVNV